MSAQSISQPSKKIPALKFAALFVMAFLAVFTGGLIYDVLATMRENQQTEEASLAQPALKPIEPKIERELTEVLALNSIPNAVEIKNPFTDRGGFSSDSKPPAGSIIGGNAALRQTSAAPSGSDQRPGNSAVKISPENGAADKSGNYNGMPEIAANYDASPAATNQRIRARLDRMRLGQDGGPESAVLAIDDLLPVGVVSGGSGATEIMLYSQALSQTFSFPVGTRFYDGWLVDWRAEGVGFGYENQNNAVFLKSWTRSIKRPDDAPTETENPPAKDSPNG